MTSDLQLASKISPTLALEQLIYLESYILDIHMNKKAEISWQYFVVLGAKQI